MSFLSRSSAEEELTNKLIEEHETFLKEFLDSQSIKDLKESLIIIAKRSGTNEARSYMDYVLNRMSYVKNKDLEYKLEAALADKIGHFYVPEGISKSDKLNNRFEAAQNMKLDVLIEQNDRIIALLEELLHIIRY